MQNFFITKDIRQAILESPNQILFGTQVFPLVAPENTKFPFIIIKRTKYIPVENKDYEDEIVFVEVMIVADNYEQSVNIADSIADYLIYYRSRMINKIRIADISEDFLDNSYVQRIQFEVILN